MKNTSTGIASPVTEAVAAEILLIKALELSSAADELLNERDLRQAERAAEARGDPDCEHLQWIAARAHALTHLVASRHPVFLDVARWIHWHAAALAVATLLAVVVGVSVGLTDRGHTINLLAPPVGLLVLWNLIVLVLSQLVKRPLWTSLLSPAVTRLLALRVDRIAAAGAGGQHVMAAFAHFVLLWPSATHSLQMARVRTLLHLTAAIVALTVISALYLRGLVFGYEVSWSSTFLDANAVHAVLATVLAPAAAISGIELPDQSILTAIRSGSADTLQRSAAPWIHLWSVTLAILVVVPRLALAARCGLQARRQARQLHLDTEDPYFKRLCRIHRARHERLRLLPAFLSPASDDLARWGSLLRRAAPDAEEIQIEKPIDEQWQPGEQQHSDELWLLLMGLGITPEPEVHGDWLKRLKAAGPCGLVLLLDEQDVIRRFGPQSPRRAARRLAWQRLAEEAGITVCCVNPQDPDRTLQAERLADAIDIELQ